MARRGVILLGSPGSGKGTQSQMLIEESLAFHISTGDLLRYEIHHNTDIGLMVKTGMASGSLVDDETVRAVLDRGLKRGFDSGAEMIVFDGYPRTTNQVVAFEKLCQENDIKQIVVVLLNITLDDLEDRIVNRVRCNTCGAVYNLKTKTTQTEGVCDKCGSSDFEKRSDDNRASLEKRRDEYQEKSEPVIALLRDKRYPFIELNANLAPKAVFDKIKQGLGEIFLDQDGLNR